MEQGTLIELQRGAVDFWATDGYDATFEDDHIGLLQEGDWVIFLGVSKPPPQVVSPSHPDDNPCDLLHVVTRYGVGFINSHEVPEYNRK